MHSFQCKTYPDFIFYKVLGISRLYPSTVLLKRFIGPETQGIRGNKERKYSTKTIAQNPDIKFVTRWLRNFRDAGYRQFSLMARYESRV
jgi:hypothetical protein